MIYILKLWYRAERFFVIVLLAAASCLGLYQVIARYMLGWHTFWVEEIIRYIIIAMALVGSSIVLSKDAHVKVDVLITHLHQKPKVLLLFITDLVGFGFSLCLLWSAMLLVLDATANGVVSDSELRFPLSIAFSPLLIGAFLLSLRFAQRIAQKCGILFKGNTNQKWEH